MRLDDNFDNGKGRSPRDDDFQEISIKAGLVVTPKIGISGKKMPLGKVTFRFINPDTNKNVSSKFSLWSDQGTMFSMANSSWTFTLNGEIDLPEKLFVRAIGLFTAETTVVFEVEYTLPGFPSPLFSDVIRLTIVRTIGDKHYFRAAVDYIFEQNTEFFTDHISFDPAAMRIVVMRQEATTLTALDSRTPPPAGAVGNPQGDIDDIIILHPKQSVIVNGGFFNPTPAFGVANVYNGTLITGGAIAPLSLNVYPNVINMNGSNRSVFIAQLKSSQSGNPGAFVFGKGTFIGNGLASLVTSKSATIAEGIDGFPAAMTATGGITEDGTGYEKKYANLIGEAPVIISPNDRRKVIFVAQSWADVDISSNISKFIHLAHPSGSSSIYLLDGSSSLALAHKFPATGTGRLKVINYLTAGRHTLPGGGDVNNFLMFKCKLPKP